VGLGSIVQCTFTNTQACTITITKKTNPAGGTGFSFSSAWSGLQGITLNDGQSISKPVPCGLIFNVFETPKPGSALTNIACAFSGGTGNFKILGATTGATNGFEPGDNEVNFDSLTPGGNLQCTFTNITSVVIPNLPMQGGNEKTPCPVLGVVYTRADAPLVPYLNIMLANLDQQCATKGPGLKLVSIKFRTCCSDPRGPGFGPNATADLTCG
jgi:hypothetical protein